MVRFRIILLVLILIAVPIVTNAQTYKMESSVLDEAGESSTGSTMKVWHNFGEPIVGISESDDFRLYSGFWHPDQPMLYFTITPSVIDYGLLTNSNIQSKRVAIKVTSNLLKGFSVYAHDNTLPGQTNGLLSGKGKISDVGTPNTYVDIPTVGTEFYGITVSGNHASSGYSNGTKMNSLDNANLTSIGGYNNIIFNDVYNVDFKVGVAQDTTSSDDYGSATSFLITVNY